MLAKVGSSFWYVLLILLVWGCAADRKAKDDGSYVSTEIRDDTDVHEGEIVTTVTHGPVITNELSDPQNLQTGLALTHSTFPNESNGSCLITLSVASNGREQENDIAIGFGSQNKQMIFLRADSANPLRSVVWHYGSDGSLSFKNADGQIFYWASDGEESLARVYASQRIDSNSNIRKVHFYRKSGAKTGEICVYPGKQCVSAVLNKKASIAKATVYELRTGSSASLFKIMKPIGHFCGF